MYQAVPPPPPPRSTLPPVRPGPEITAAASGVGSAKGVRWRGELESIQRRADATKAAKRAASIAAAHGQPPPPASEYADDEEQVELTEEVVKSAPPWLISTVIHLVLLLILALISTPAGHGVSKVLLTFAQGDQRAPVELAEFSIDSNVDMSEQDVPEETQFDTPIPEIFETVQPEISEIAPVEIGVGDTKIDIAKPMFNGRTGAMRKALLAIYGGTPETEEAVALGLQWLKRNQQRNGSWSMRGPYGDTAITENRTAATAMALLAFLGDGNTHKSGEYADEVDKGIKFLLQQQDRSGFMAKSARGHEKMYAQAQATIALCELYGMTKDSWLRPRAQLAIDFAEQAQSEIGGWRYEPKFDADTSVTGWFVMALQSGRSAELDVNESLLRRVSGFLDSVSSYDGAAYSYQARGNPSPAMTAEGLLCRQYLGWTRDNPSMERGIWALLEDSPFSIRDGDVYYWYYATQVLHHFGGSPWRLWNEKMREQLPAAQVKSGKEAGSWAPQRDTWGRNYGRLYTTCLSLYCLEVYYRHMPLYKPQD